MRNAQPVPMAAMIRPATAGPIIRAALNEVELSADRVGQVLVADQFRDEGLAHRRIERRGAAEQEGEDVDVPQLDDAGDGEQPQRQRQHAHRRLRGDQQLALVEMVGREPGPGQQQKLRPELQRHDHARRPRRCDG